LSDVRFDSAAQKPPPSPWDALPPRLRAAGLRWTPQRRILVEVLKGHQGHVTASEIIARCRELDPSTTPSTVYRTLDVLENLGLVRHGHGPDGREEYHVLPQGLHGHVYCTGCGQSWEITSETGTLIADALEKELGFEIDLSHVTVSGLCRHCHD
jgi:Fur family ferric uptake transcriptional regulator